jgi:hypothetical protein
MTTMPNHPTPQPSGRTAEEILDTAFCEGMASTQNVHNPDWMEQAQRQLFDAICSEVIGPDRTINKQYSDYDVAKDAGYNERGAKVRQRLRVFFNQLQLTSTNFNQAEASGDNGEV